LIGGKKMFCPFALCFLLSTKLKRLLTADKGSMDADKIIKHFNSRF